MKCKDTQAAAAALTSLGTLPSPGRSGVRTRRRRRRRSPVSVRYPAPAAPGSASAGVPGPASPTPESADPRSGSELRLTAHLCILLCGVFGRPRWRVPVSCHESRAPSPVSPPPVPCCLPLPPGLSACFAPPPPVSPAPAESAGHAPARRSAGRAAHRHRPEISQRRGNGPVFRGGRRRRPVAAAPCVCAASMADRQPLMPCRHKLAARGGKNGPTR